MPLLLSRAFCFLHSRSRPSMANLSASCTSIRQQVRLKGVVFDMDGTLTVPAIDFPAMYKAVLGEQEYASIRSQNPSGIDILHQIENWSPDKQQKAYEIIADFERQGLERLQIMPGAAELCGFLDLKKIRHSMTVAMVVPVPALPASFPETTASSVEIQELRDEEMRGSDSSPPDTSGGAALRGLITRNVKAAVDLFHLRFGMTFSPALSREFRPYKPDPAPLLHICATWDVHPSEVIMIGDSLKDDVACGKRAGAFTCLLDETGRYDSPEFDSVDLKPDFKVSSLTEVCSLLEANFNLKA